MLPLTALTNTIHGSTLQLQALVSCLIYLTVLFDEKRVILFDIKKANASFVEVLGTHRQAIGPHGQLEVLDEVMATP